MNAYPTALEIIEDGKLQIDWSDGQRRRYTFRKLRDGCPCAICDEERNAEQQEPALLPVLSPTEMRPFRIQGMRPVGNYATQSLSATDTTRASFAWSICGALGRR
jgi:DUF971 family protein